MRTAVRVLASSNGQQHVVPNGMDCEAGQAASTLHVTCGDHPRHVQSTQRSHANVAAARPGNAAVSHCSRPATLS